MSRDKTAKIKIGVIGVLVAFFMGMVYLVFWLAYFFIVLAYLMSLALDGDGVFVAWDGALGIWDGVPGVLITKIWGFAFML